MRALGLGERLGRLFPAAAFGVESEQRIAHPGRAGPDLGRALEIRERHAVIAAPRRLNEEPAQTQELDVLVGEHGGETFFGRFFIAGELGCLRGDEKRERLVGKQRLGFARAALGLVRVAGRDRHHAARDGAKAALAPPLGALKAHAARRAEKRRNQARRGKERRHGERHDEEPEGQARLELVSVEAHGEPA